MAHQRDHRWLLPGTFVDRAVLTSLRGGDASSDLAEAERLLPGMSDSQYASYCHWGRAWDEFTAGRLAEAGREADAAFRTTDYFRAVSLPIAARAALWAGAADEASAVIDELAGPGMRGQAIALDITTLRAGLAALEGRRSDAIAGYREALRGWRQLGLAFDEALAALDMAILLAPTEREMAEAPAAIDAARETLTRIEARPLLARLDAGPIVAAEASPGDAAATAEDRRVNV